VKIEIERIRDPLQVQLEAEVLAKLAQLSKIESPVESVSKSRGLPHDNRIVSPEEAAAELARLGITS